MGLHDKEAAERDASQKRIDDAVRRQTEEVRKQNAQRSSGGGGGGGNSGCFASDTLIETPSGRSVISELQVGDQVVALNPASGELEACDILRTVSVKNVCIWTIHLENGQTLKTTRDHSFLDNKGMWRTTKQLSAGDFLNTRFGDVEINSIHESSTCEDVHNLIVSGSYIFIAEGCIVHSFTRLRSLRVALYRSFVEPLVGIKRLAARTKILVQKPS